MRLTNKYRRSGVHAACWIAFLVSAAVAQDRGTLVVSSVPDGAVVVLDNSKDAERQHTPFTNESMIPGTHSVLLRPANPAFKSVVYDVNIEAGQSSSLEHTFEYRTKGYDLEHLAVAPWKFEVGLGFEARRYIGMESEKQTTVPNALPGAPKPTEATAMIPKSYPADSIPNSMYIPVNFRLGFPGGWEGHFQFPFGSYASPKTKKKDREGISVSDPGFGVKWIYTPYNSGLDLSYTFGSNHTQNLGTRSDALIATAITNQRWGMFDLAGNLGCAVHFSRFDDPDIGVGNTVFVKARGGLLLAEQFLPLVQAGFHYSFADKKSGKDKDANGNYYGNPANFQLTLTPGFIWYAGQDVSLELGVPLTLLASNAETSWGGHLSLAWDFSLATKTKSSVPKKGAAISAYPLQTVGVPASSATNILFDSKEVSNAEYKEFCDKTGREYPVDPEFTGMPGYFTDPKTGNYPVVKISIDDARAYAAWVGKRLPTVTEWRKEIESANITGGLVACGLEAPEPVGSRHQGSGLYNVVGNVAEWVENDRKVGSVAYIAGGFFSLPRERCLDKGRWVDVASPAGAKYIGMRLVTEVK